MKFKNNRYGWQNLREGNILGIVDANGSVDSVFSASIEYHTNYWPISQIAWRWNNSQSLYWMIERRPNTEQVESIMRHITKRYGIKWFENGHHDWEHLQEMCKMEKKKLQLFPS